MVFSKLIDKVAKNPTYFEEAALQLFAWQARHIPVYKKYLSLLNIAPESVLTVEQIPHLPISAFKHHVILPEGVSANRAALVFKSSGTTGSTTSSHYVLEKDIYHLSFSKSFKLFYGAPSQYCLLALLPNYLEQGNSSLVYMAKHLIAETEHEHSGFYLNNIDELAQQLTLNEASGQKSILLGVTYALLDFADAYPQRLQHTTIIETGGMKGRRKEITKEAVHSKLKKSFGLQSIGGEYGMTELLSQAYALRNGEYQCPPWMRISTRQINDPFAAEQVGKTACINIIDLANVNSCAFIATQDLGQLLPSGKFKVLGRLDNSDLRGCNLMVT